MKTQRACGWGLINDGESSWGGGNKIETYMLGKVDYPD